MQWKFKLQYTFEQRRQESTLILRKYSDRIPVILERAFDGHINEMDKYKFLVPHDCSVAQFMWIIRKRTNLNPNKSLYLFVNKTLPKACALMGELYQLYKDEDGFLYVMYNGENTFGN